MGRSKKISMLDKKLEDLFIEFDEAAANLYVDAEIAKTKAELQVCVSQNITLVKEALLEISRYVEREEN